MTETGGGPKSPSCLKYLCEPNEFTGANADVNPGVLGRNAGDFDVYSYNQTKSPFKAKKGFGN